MSKLTDFWSRAFVGAGKWVLKGAVVWWTLALASLPLGTAAVLTYVGKELYNELTDSDIQFIRPIAKATRDRIGDLFTWSNNNSNNNTRWSASSNVSNSSSTNNTNHVRNNRNQAPEVCIRWMISKHI